MIYIGSGYNIQKVRPVINHLNLVVKGIRQNKEANCGQWHFEFPTILVCVLLSDDHRKSAITQTQTSAKRVRHCASSPKSIPMNQELPSQFLCKRSNSSYQNRWRGAAAMRVTALLQPLFLLIRII